MRYLRICLALVAVRTPHELDGHEAGLGRIVVAVHVHLFLVDAEELALVLAHLAQAFGRYGLECTLTASIPTTVFEPELLTGAHVAGNFNDFSLVSSAFVLAPAVALEHDAGVRLVEDRLSFIVVSCQSDGHVHALLPVEGVIWGEVLIRHRSENVNVFPVSPNVDLLIGVSANDYKHQECADGAHQRLHHRLVLTHLHMKGLTEEIEALCRSLCLGETPLATAAIAVAARLSARVFRRVHRFGLYR